jgi:hypothetical protein
MTSSSSVPEIQVSRPRDPRDRPVVLLSRVDPWPHRVFRMALSVGLSDNADSSGLRAGVQMPTRGGTGAPHRPVIICVLSGSWPWSVPTGRPAIGGSVPKRMARQASTCEVVRVACPTATPWRSRPARGVAGQARAAGRTSPPSRAMAIARCRQVSRSALTRLQDRMGPTSSSRRPRAVGAELPIATAFEAGVIRHHGHVEEPRTAASRPPTNRSKLVNASLQQMGLGCCLVAIAGVVGMVLNGPSWWGLFLTSWCAVVGGVIVRTWVRERRELREGPPSAGA